MEQLIDEGRLLAVDEVLRELEKKDDTLHDWAGQHGELFVPLDQPIINRATAIISRFPSLVDTSRMRGTADPFVIGLAVEQGLSVVTAEKPKPTKPKIPDVCQALNVPCISLLELFRREGWTV